MIQKRRNAMADGSDAALQLRVFVNNLHLILPAEPASPASATLAARRRRTGIQISVSDHFITTRANSAASPGGNRAQALLEFVLSHGPSPATPLGVSSSSSANSSTTSSPLSSPNVSPMSSPRRHKTLAYQRRRRNGCSVNLEEHFATPGAEPLLQFLQQA